MSADAKSFLPSWESEKLFYSGRAFFSALEEDLRQSQKSISLEVYIYEDDSLGRRLADLLVEAHRRGVRVRVIVDGIGSPTWQTTVAPRLLRAGIQIKVFRPVPFFGAGSATLRPQSAQPLSRLLQEMNHRNHRKLCVIDEQTAYLGSMNISSKHVEGLSPEPTWRDTGVSVMGDPVRLLQSSFDRIWSGPELGFKKGRVWSTPTEARSPLVFLNHTLKERRFRYRELLLRIRNSQRRVWVTSAYFVPRRSLIRALQRAARAGRDVRVMLPGSSDVFFMPWVQSTFYQGLLKAGVRILEYQPSVLHAKTLQVDDWSLVGSANLNHRSLLHDLEVEVVVTKPASIESLSHQFRTDQSQCVEIRLEQWEKAAWLRKNLGQSLLFLRNWF